MDRMTSLEPFRWSWAFPSPLQWFFFVRLFWFMQDENQEAIVRDDCPPRIHTDPKTGTTFFYAQVLYNSGTLIFRLELQFQISPCCVSEKALDCLSNYKNVPRLRYFVSFGEFKLYEVPYVDKTQRRDLVDNDVRSSLNEVFFSRQREREVCVGARRRGRGWLLKNFWEISIETILVNRFEPQKAEDSMFSHTLFFLLQLYQHTRSLRLGEEWTRRDV